MDDARPGSRHLAADEDAADYCCFYISSPFEMQPPSPRSTSTAIHLPLAFLFFSFVSSILLPFPPVGPAYRQRHGIHHSLAQAEAEAD
jgi:hypothetical protein